jgi:hypothetical protein
VRRLLESGALPRSGTLLDVGAGSGAMLAAFSAASDDWTLFGLDLDNRKERALEAIPRFEQLFTVPPEQLSRSTCITLIHLWAFHESAFNAPQAAERIAPGRLS